MHFFLLPIVIYARLCISGCLFTSQSLLNLGHNPCDQAVILEKKSLVKKVPSACDCGLPSHYLMFGIIPLQLMHEKSFFISTNKCGNKSLHESKDSRVIVKSWLYHNLHRSCMADGNSASLCWLSAHLRVGLVNPTFNYRECKCIYTLLYILSSIGADALICSTLATPMSYMYILLG